MSLSRPARRPSAAAGRTLHPGAGRRLGILWAVLLAGVLLGGGALAQLPSLPTEPGVNLTAQSQSRVLQRDSCATYEVTVTNSGATVDELGPVMGEIGRERIRFELSSPAQGWIVSEAPSPVELARGDSTAVSVRLCAGETVERGSRTNVVLTAILEPASPADEEQRDNVALRAEVEQEGVFGLPFDFPPWVLWIVLGALGVMLAAILVTRRGHGAGVVLECTEPGKEVTPGRGTSFPVRIINEGRTKDLVSLTTSPVPQGWDTFLPIVDVPLEAGDEQTVWISVKSPDDVREGDHVVVKVFARSSSTAGQQASIDLTVTVRGPFLPDEKGAGGSSGGGEGSRSVYEPEDAEGPKSRAVAVKRPKS